MKFVIRIAFEIHFPGVPIALLGHALGCPMGPDSKFRVSKPVGAAITLLERLPSGFERSGGNISLSRRLDGAAEICFFLSGSLLRRRIFICDSPPGQKSEDESDSNRRRTGEQH